MSCSYSYSYSCSSQFEQYTNHPVVHVDTYKVAAWNHAVITAITGHHVFQSVWALTDAHFQVENFLFLGCKGGLGSMSTFHSRLRLLLP